VTRAGLQNLLQLFVTNAANVFLLEVSPEYPILLEEQVEMCKRVLNIYRYRYTISIFSVYRSPFTIKQLSGSVRF
jgi:hypothetical protein